MILGPERAPTGHLSLQTCKFVDHACRGEGSMRLNLDHKGGSDKEYRAKVMPRLLRLPREC
jgi:hypothetical protein